MKKSTSTSAKTKVTTPYHFIRTLADLGITQARAIVLASNTHDVGAHAGKNHDSFYERELATCGRVIHESYGCKVVIIDATEDATECDGSIDVIMPVVIVRSDGEHVIWDGIFPIGYVDDETRKFVSNDAMSEAEHVERIGNIIPSMSRSSAEALSLDAAKRNAALLAKIEANGAGDTAKGDA